MTPVTAIAGFRYPKGPLDPSGSVESPREMRAGAAEDRSAPERIALDARPGSPPDPRPPVRIFLGSEPAQQRAERVFLWSVERVRNPSRRYEIWLLEGLSGFRRRGWTTGFTNYRFAIPHYAGGAGRALYNDVDQIYLADPAELFDADLGDHGFLAVAPDDPSVMLLDCARMAAVWTLDAARSLPKAELIRRALAVPRLHGPLPAAWNARDDEYEPGRSRCLHFTTLHTQPWRPFPERFVYQANPRARLWLDLEAEADRLGYRVFTRERPSSRYREAGADPPLEQTPGHDLPWRLDELFRRPAPALRIEIACEAPRATDPAGERARTPEWWCERLETAAAAHPGVRWEAVLLSPGGRRRERVGGPPPGGEPPRVWVLTDDRGGNSTQSIGLAERLGWPYERKSLRPGPLSALHNRLLGASRAGISRQGSDPLAPPWPDLVIAAGRRTAPVALWIREQSRGRTRLVQLGRKGGDAADRFDLVATPAYCRLFPHPHRVETCAPLHALTPDRIADARERWRARFAPLPSPRIAVLVGGSSGQYRIDAAQAGRLGAEVARIARELGGSVLATTSRRTGPAAVAALCAALGQGAFVYRAGDAGENPYPGLLAWADRIVVTADSESMLAEAASTGKPTWIYPPAAPCSESRSRGTKGPGPGGAPGAERAPGAGARLLTPGSGRPIPPEAGRWKPFATSSAATRGRAPPSSAASSSPGRSRGSASRPSSPCSAWC